MTPPICPECECPSVIPVEAHPRSLEISSVNRVICVGCGHAFPGTDEEVKQAKEAEEEFERTDGYS